MPMCVTKSLLADSRSSTPRSQLAARPAGKEDVEPFPYAHRGQCSGIGCCSVRRRPGVDVVNRTADVLGMTTYEHLVDATLPHGLMPLVVPQLKTITLGGAVTGLGIESSSFREGLPHESVLEMTS